MSWEYLRSLLYRYWYYALFAVMTLALVVVSYYYLQTQFARRKQRLRTVHIYEVKKRGELSPESAPLDPLINEMLFPEPEVYLPLQEKLPLKEHWGPLMRNWKLRVEPPSLQAAPELFGPS